MNYYNEFDPKAAAWLREIIRQGLIPAGDVDERSITEISPHDLSGYKQCHFFAGIGGWSYALKLSGWPEDTPVWTGSCPCQPFSAAGKQRGESDHRHLWPVFRDLIAFAQPATVFGEQVASKLGRQWLAGVFSDLENLGYAAAGADLCAAGLGSPHIRQRLYWVADTPCPRRSNSNDSSRKAGRAFPLDRNTACRLGNPHSAGLQQGQSASSIDRHRIAIVADGGTGRVGDTDCAGLCEYSGSVAVSPEQPATQLRGDIGAWSDYDFIPCADGKARRVESGTFPLAHGIPARVGRLRGYGNAIVPQAAAEFIRAFLESGNPEVKHDE